MPFTIHLDPYLRKVIKEERANFLAMQSGTVPNMSSGLAAKDIGNLPRETGQPSGPIHTGWNTQPWSIGITLPTPEQSKASIYPKYPPMIPTITHGDYGGLIPSAAYLPAVSVSNQVFFKSSLPARFEDRPLSSFSAEEIAEMLRHLDGVRSSQVCFRLLLNYIEDVSLFFHPG